MLSFVRDQMFIGSRYVANPAGSLMRSSRKTQARPSTWPAVMSWKISARMCMTWFDSTWRATTVRSVTLWCRCPMGRPACCPRSGIEAEPGSPTLRRWTTTLSDSMLRIADAPDAVWVLRGLLNDAQQRG